MKLGHTEDHEHEHTLFAHDGYGLSGDHMFPSSPRHSSGGTGPASLHTTQLSDGLDPHGRMPTVASPDIRRSARSYGSDPAPSSGDLPSDMIDTGAMGGLVGAHDHPEQALLDRLMQFEDDARQKLCHVIDTINRITATTTQPDFSTPPPNEHTLGMSEQQRNTWCKYAQAAQDVLQAQHELNVLQESYGEVLAAVLRNDSAPSTPTGKEVLVRLGLMKRLAGGTAEETEEAPSPAEGWTRESQYWFKNSEGVLHFVPGDSLEPEAAGAAPGVPRQAVVRFKMPPLESFYDIGHTGMPEKPMLTADITWDNILSMIKRQDLLWNSYPIPTLGQFSPQNGADPQDPKFWTEVEQGIIRLWAYYKVDEAEPSLSTLRKHFGSSWLTSSQMRSRWKRLQEIQRFIEQRVEVESMSIFSVARTLVTKMQNYRTEDGKENPICTLAMLSDLLVAERTGGIGAHIPKRASKKRKATDHGDLSDSPLTPLTPDTERIV